MKPNPEELAKMMIWNLASLRIEVQQLNTKLDMLCEQQGVNVSSTAKGREIVKAMKDDVFLKAMKAVGIEAGEGWPPNES